MYTFLFLREVLWQPTAASTTWLAPAASRSSRCALGLAMITCLVVFQHLSSALAGRQPPLLRPGAAAASRSSEVRYCRHQAGQCVTQTTAQRWNFTRMPVTLNDKIELHAICRRRRPTTAPCWKPSQKVCRPTLNCRSHHLQAMSTASRQRASSPRTARRWRPLTSSSPPPGAQIASTGCHMHHVHIAHPLCM